MNRSVTFAAALLIVPASVLACLWDYDTLQMERERFPQVAELLAGKFLRHSHTFYEWRIENRLKRIEESPEDASLYDDLAVAYDKTGQHQKAIETILKVQDFDPDRYETLANLGTFHIHNGDLETGSEFISKAIEINPDAHFGRELYQKLLVEYVLSKKVDGKLPMPMSDEAVKFNRRGFARFVMLRQSGDEMAGDKDGELKKAVKGITGMMHFGHHDSPVLLEALADLLMGSFNEDSARLATRAWLKASYVIDDPEIAAIYRANAEKCLEMQVNSRGSTVEVKLAEIEEQFKRELTNGDNWFAEVSEDEALWIASGEDVDEAFRTKYYSNGVPKPLRLSERPVQDASQHSGLTRWLLSKQGYLLYVIIIVFFVYSKVRVRLARRDASSEH